MHTDSLLLNALYYLLAAVITVPLFKRLGLGSILGYLFAGIVLGPHALGIIEDPESVLHFAEYGVILLLFVIGLELAPEKLWSMRNHIVVLGGSQVLLTGLVIGFGMVMLVALPLACCVFIGFGQRGVGVDGAQNFVEAQAVLHGQHVFRQQVSGVGAYDGHTQDFVFARHG